VRLGSAQVTINRAEDITRIVAYGFPSPLVPVPESDGTLLLLGIGVAAMALSASAKRPSFFRAGALSWAWALL
jgi:hypothetical protein